MDFLKKLTFFLLAPIFLPAILLLNLGMKWWESLLD